MPITTEDPGIRIYSEEKEQHQVLSTLKIKTAELNNAGTYLCTAKNIGFINDFNLLKFQPINLMI